MRAIILLLTLLGSMPASAADGPVKTVNADGAGLALKGYDAVAYFVDRKAVEGLPAFEYEWNGARWRFANATNRERFSKNPEGFAPQFGGYCAWAVSRNYTADTDPEAFDVVDGKLYLNYSKLVQLRWKVDRSENIRKADRNWPRLRQQPTKGTK
jgi:YHS domain-containing protein